VRNAVDVAGRVNGRRNGTGTGGLELATALCCGGEPFIAEEESVKATRGILDESLDRGAESGAPGLVGGGIVPVGDDETRLAAQNDAEVGVGVEEPLAGDCWVRDAGLARAKAGLEMLGAGFERQEMDALAEPPASADEEGQA
jgi:hypothetical protein